MERKEENKPYYSTEKELPNKRTIVRRQEAISEFG